MIDLKKGFLFLVFAYSLPSIGYGYSQECSVDFMPSTPSNQFADHLDGTVTHKKTGLMWKKCAEGKTWDSLNKKCTGNALFYSWNKAFEHIEVINVNGGFNGYTDWRLPNIKELASIVEKQCDSPSINAVIFPNLSTSSYDDEVYNFWSSTPSTQYSYGAQYIRFSFGNDNWTNKSSLLSIRLVRDSN